ncbi:tetratricopeptide repeat protein [Emticicia sp. CRIBPO]|uniref:tetratricopeptide repeat-containing sensor histidine kinase n=1 Tax=Emticicia sp. CRIBPO TaxID=2683258 RepID=UPI001413570E|nr:tetratricopeptide repeat-containing sensor histidine kinase [Emticicia sp. CRIBPO]NBA86530.1 tetratricopeptide repeat protein [Emticicia sp. CRIBPO]
MKKLSIIFLLLGCCYPVSGQKAGQALIDSLLSEIPRAKNDTVKVRLHKRVADEYFFIDVSKAMEYSKTGLKLATAMKWERGIGVFITYIAQAYSGMGVYDSCMHYYKKGYVIQKKADDKANMTSTLNNMGAAEQNLNSNFTKAVEYYLAALKMAEQTDDKYMMGNTLANISNVYIAQKNPKKSLEYAFRALAIRRKLVSSGAVNADREVGRSMSNIGNIYVDLKDTLNAGKYFRKALPLLLKTEDKDALANLYTYMSLIYPRDSPQKISYALKAEQMWDEVNPMHSDAINNLGNIGVIYLDKVREGSPSLGISLRNEYLSKSEKYLRKAIFLSNQKGEVGAESYFKGPLAELQAIRGDYKNAYLNFRDYQNVQDSLYSQENKNNIAGLEGKREIELRDKQIEINQLELDAQKRQRIGLLIGLGLIVAIVGLLYWQNQTRKRANIQLLRLNSELDEANKIKARFFAILSHDLRSPVANLVNFLHLQKEAPDLLSAEAVVSHQKRITESAENLLENMESMLLWSKSQMQHFKPQSREIEVDSLFGYIQKFFVSETRISFSFENPGSLKVVTDEDYLKTIMQNLTNNAVKALAATPDPQIRWEATKKGSQVILAIIDNGPGTSAGQLNALFSEEAEIGIKSGLGLHVVRDLAKAIACKISVQPNSGRGMEFRLVFG